MIIQDDTRAGAKERLAFYVSAAVLASVIAGSWHYTKQTNASIHRMEGRVEATTAVNDQLATTNAVLMAQRDSLLFEIERLNALPPIERIVYRPCVEADPTPVFSRDSRFIGTHR